MKATSLGVNKKIEKFRSPDIVFLKEDNNRCYNRQALKSHTMLVYLLCIKIKWLGV